jgi:hypothetical protein
MRALFLSLTVVLGMLLAAEAMACEANADCEPGTHCQIDAGRRVGVCVNDAAATPDERETIETPPIDGDDGAGQPCTTHEDCGVGGRCVKQPGAQSGTCRDGR